MPDQETGQPPMWVKCNCNSTSGCIVLQKITPIDSMPTLDYVRYIKEKWRIESVCNASLREWVFCCHAQNVLFPTLYATCITHGKFCWEVFEGPCTSDKWFPSSWQSRANLIHLYVLYDPFPWFCQNLTHTKDQIITKWLNPCQDSNVFVTILKAF